MYKIIGSDQKEYGPITADQVRQWIAEGRANAQTRAQAEGSTEWQPLSAFPEFAGLFAAPTATPGAYVPPMAALSTDASARVQGPATGLIVVAALNFLMGAGGLIMNVVGTGMRRANSSGNPEIDQLIQMTSGGLGIVSNLIAIGVGVVILMGALKMKKLENYGFAMTAAILAMIPCLSCCIVGLPIGIWALVILLKPEVKSSFH